MSVSMVSMLHCSVKLLVEDARLFVSSHLLMTRHVTDVMLVIFQTVFSHCNNACVCVLYGWASLHMVVSELSNKCKGDIESHPFSTF